MIQTMGSRPEVTAFILQMTQANEQKRFKRNEKKSVLHEDYGPMAWCNRTHVTTKEQGDAQMEAYAELVHYVAKVGIFTISFGSRQNRSN